ncbi:MAG TPA: peptidylprolyl isomerase [Patescibacteria group bacterium]|nr:peptidylprolyl isomerase [Patescibacteria group bacterium]
MAKWVVTIIIIVGAGVAAFFLMPKPAVAPETGVNPTSSTPTPQPAAPSPYMNKQVTLDTTLGKIKVEFYAEDAPRAVENFVRLAEKDYYNSTTFHRVIKGFMIQGGDPKGDGTGGESIWGGTFEDELNPAATSYQQGYRKGVLAMANRGPNTNGSQFFILLEDTPNLQRQYTIFGHVVEGQNIVDKIGDSIVDPELDRPITQVVIKSMTVIDKK